MGEPLIIRSQSNGSFELGQQPEQDIGLQRSSLQGMREKFTDIKASLTNTRPLQDPQPRFEQRLNQFHLDLVRTPKIEKLAQVIAAGINAEESPIPINANRLLLSPKTTDSIKEAVKDLTSTEYLRGVRFDQEYEALQEQITEKLLDKLGSNNPRLPTKSDTQNKALLKNLLFAPGTGNLFEMKFALDKERGPVFQRDFTTPQDTQAIKTAYGCSAALLIQEATKTKAADSVFQQQDPQLDQRAKDLFRALENFVNKSKAADAEKPIDVRVLGEVKGLLDKGFNPKFGGIGRFPKPMDADANEKFMGWAFQKFDSTKGLSGNQQVLGILEQELQYFNQNIEAYLENQAQDPLVRDNLAIQIHGTIGQIFNDILLNDKLDLRDRGRLLQELKEANVLPKAIDLKSLAELQQKIRASPLLMEIDNKAITSQVAEKALESLKPDLGKDYALAKEVLQTGLMRSGVAELDTVSGRRGRFKDINAAFCQAWSSRDKPLEKTVTNMPDGRLDAKAQELICEGIENGTDLNNKISQGLFAHGMRPKTAQRSTTLPSLLRDLTHPDPKQRREAREVFTHALKREQQVCNREIAEKNQHKEELQRALDELAGGKPIDYVSKSLITKLFGGWDSDQNQEFIPKLRNQIEVTEKGIAELEKRAVVAEKLLTTYQAKFIATNLEKNFGQLVVEDQQGRNHRLGDLAQEKSVANMIHSQGLRTLCSISGTTTDIGMAMVAQYGEEKVKTWTNDLLGFDQALKNGVQPLPELPREFKEFFTSTSLFMQGGQYHTPAEVLGGMLVVAAAIENPKLAGNETAIQASYQRLLGHLAKAPQDFTIVDQGQREHFAQQLPEKQQALFEAQKAIIVEHAKQQNIQYWYTEGSQRAGFFDDSSLPESRTQLLSGHRQVKDDFELTKFNRAPGTREQIRERLEAKPVAVQPRKQPLAYEQEFEKEEPTYNRGHNWIRGAEQHRELASMRDWGQQPQIAHHRGWKKETQAAREKAQNARELEILQENQAKTWQSPLKDLLDIQKNLLSAPKDVMEAIETAQSMIHAEENLSKAEMPDALSYLGTAADTIGVVKYSLGIIKARNKQKVLAADLEKSEQTLKAYQRLETEVGKAEKLHAQRKEELAQLKEKLTEMEGGLSSLESKQNTLAILQRNRNHLQDQLEEKSSRQPQKYRYIGESRSIIEAEIQKLDEKISPLEQTVAKLQQQTRDYEVKLNDFKTALANQASNQQAVIKLRELLDARMPIMDDLEKTVGDLRYKLKENSWKQYVRYPAGIIASGSKLISWLGSAVNTLKTGSTWLGKVSGLFGLISVVASGIRVYKTSKKINELNAQLKKTETAISAENARLQKQATENLRTQGIDQPTTEQLNREVERLSTESDVLNLLQAEQNTLKQQISDERWDRRGELLSALSGALSFASSILVMTGIGAPVAAVLAPISLGLGLAGSGMLAGVAIAKYRRAANQQNRLANLQEGYNALKNGANLNQLTTTNSAVKQIQAKLGVQATSDSVMQEISKALTQKYVNVTGQAVYRNLIAELETLAQGRDSFLPAPSKNLGNKAAQDVQTAYFSRLQQSYTNEHGDGAFERDFPTLTTLCRRLTPLDLAQVVYAGSDKDGMVTLLGKLNLKAIRTENYTADAFDAAPRSQTDLEHDLQAATTGLHGNKFESGQLGVAIALRKHAADYAQALRAKSQESFADELEDFSESGMVTGTRTRAFLNAMAETSGVSLHDPDARQPETVLRALLDKAGQENRLQSVDIRTDRELSDDGEFIEGNSKNPVSLQRIAQRKLNVLPKTEQDRVPFYLTMERFQNKDQRKKLDIVVNPFGTIQKADEKSIELAPDLLICNRGESKQRANHVTYERRGDQWFLNQKGERLRIDLSPEIIAEKRTTNNANLPERMLYQQIYRDLYENCVLVGYSDNNRVDQTTKEKNARIQLGRTEQLLNDQPRLERQGEALRKNLPKLPQQEFPVERLKVELPKAFHASLDEFNQRWQTATENANQFQSKLNNHRLKAGGLK